MISWQMKRNRIICLTYSLLSGLLSSTTAQINFTREVDSCLYVGDSLVWVAQYLGGSTVDSVNWYFHKQAVGDIVVLISTCTVFGSPDGGYPNMTYTCDSSTNTYTATISNLNGAEEGDWGVSFTFDDFTSTSTVKESLSLCIKCPIENVTDGSLNITYSAVREGEVAGLTCRKGYVSIGKSEFTCMSNGSWSPPLQGCTEKPPKPVPEPCEIILCYILLILSCVLITPVFIGIHVYLIQKGHRWAVKELTFKDFGIKACLPGCCICLLKIVIQLITYFLPFEECAVVTCLVIPIIAMPIVSGTGVAIVRRIVHRKRGKARPGNEKAEMTNEEPPVERLNVIDKRL